jgi:nucleoid-associated protein YgaU
MREATRFLALLLATGALLIGPSAIDSRAGGGFVPTDPRTEWAGPGKVTVHPGDHLWSISETRLEKEAQRQVPDEVIARYWRTVIARNQPRIRSGDPDLIYPGEVILLPERT